MVKIAVLKPGKLNLEELESHLSPLLYSPNPNSKDLDKYLIGIVADLVDIVETNDVIETVCAVSTYYVNPVETTFTTENSYSNSSRFLELIRIGTTENSLEMNQLACLASLQHTLVNGPAFLMATSYHQSQPTACDITLRDVIMIIKRRYYQKAVLCSSINTVYYYQRVEYLLPIIFGEISITTVPADPYNYMLEMHYEKSSEINIQATRISGMHTLYGRVLIINYLDKNILGSIGLRQFDRLNKACHGRLYDRSEGTEWNKHLTIKNKAGKHLCINCDKNSKIVCEGCFRVEYCGQQCQNEYREFHTDCI